MTPWAEVTCPRCKGSGEEPIVDEDGCVVRDLCSYCGGAGSWLDITSGPWMAFGCTEPGPRLGVACRRHDPEDFAALMRAKATCGDEDWRYFDAAFQCTAMSAAWEAKR